MSPILIYAWEQFIYISPITTDDVYLTYKISIFCCFQSNRGLSELLLSNFENNYERKSAAILQWVIKNYIASLIRIYCRMHSFMLHYFDWFTKSSTIVIYKECNQNGLFNSFLIIKLSISDLITSYMNYLQFKNKLLNDYAYGYF